MSRMRTWLKCIGEAFKANAVKALAHFVPFGEPVYDIASDAWKRIRERQAELDGRAALQEMAQATPAEARAEAASVAREVAADQPHDVQLALEFYLSQVPAAVRKSLRRPADPSGATVPAGLRLEGPRDLVPMLPTRLPRFKPGDRPAGIGDWELEELLGVGGFGEVWRARNLYLAAPVALKFCLDAATADALRHEAKLLGRVMSQGTHPGIVRLLDTHLGIDPPCLKYEYVEGGDLAGLVRDWPALPRGPSAEARSRVLLQLAEIVGHAHRLGPAIVHRDLKPANILVVGQEPGANKEGKARSSLAPTLKVTDFGIGGIVARQALNQANRFTSTGGELVTALRGSHTPLYASPQQMRGEPADPRDDVHALGVIWYQVLAGNIGDGVPPDWRDDLKDAGVEARFLDLLGACVASRPERRPLDAAALAERLGDLLKRAAPPPPTPLPVSIPLPPPPPSFGRTVVVAKAGQADFRSIGEAIREARPGTRVLVRPGTYAEALVLNKAIEIVGDGPADAIVVEATTGDCVLMQTEEAIVRGLTLRGRAGSRGAKFFAIDVPQGRLLLENCDISNDSLACLAIHGPMANPTVRNCRIHDSKDGGGVFVFDRGRGIIEKCDVFRNHLAGVEAREGSAPIVRGCTIRDNENGGGALFGLDARGVVEDCDVFGNQLAGIEIKKQADPVVRHCKVRDGKQSGVYVHENGKGTIEGCEIAGNHNMGLRIKDGGAPVVRNCTIRDSKQNGVYVHEHGLGTIENCDVFQNEKAGVKIEEGGNPTVRGCKVRDGKSNGVFVSKDGLGTIENCDVFANQLPGVGINENGAPTVRGCKVHDNHQGGVHVYEGGRGTIVDCEIAGNKFAGVTIIGGADPTVRGCRIHGNGYEGVWVYENGRGTVEGCDLAGNGRGAWDVTPGCQVIRRDNRE